MRLFILLTLPLAIISPCIAQSAIEPSVPCPITFLDVNPVGSPGAGSALFDTNSKAEQGHIFVVKVHNVSGKKITGMKLQAAYLDATNDINDIPVVWNWTDPIKVGTDKTFRWDNSWRNEAIVGWNVRLTKVLYEDNTVWEPQSGQSCEGTYRRRGRSWWKS